MGGALAAYVFDTRRSMEHFNLLHTVRETHSENAVLADTHLHYGIHSCGVDHTGVITATTAATATVGAATSASLTEQ